MQRRPGKGKLFYGYWVLTASFLLNIVSAGCGPISFSFFVTSLARDLNWSRTEIMTAFTIFFVCSAIGGPLCGRLVHHYGGRKVIALGGLLACIGYLLISRMNDLWQYYIGYSIVGFSVAATGPVITSLIVSNWFVRNRGVAIGVMSMGAGTAGLIFTSLVIVVMLPNLGWSNTYLTFAIMTAVITIPLGALLIRTRPADVGLQPDGNTGLDNTESVHAGTHHAEGLPFRKALSTWTFWFLAIAILFISTHMGIMQNQIPHLEDLGFSAGILASTMSIVAIVSAVGPLIFGWLSDKIKIKTTSIIAVLLLVIGVLLLLNIEIDSPAWFIWMYAIILGLGIGGWMANMSLLTSHNFGLIAYGTIFGVLNAFQSLGGAVSPIFSGYFYDKTGSYDMAFITMMVLIALGLPFILALRRPRPAA
ncbi:MAG: MFS transporter [Dehalococcoidales bacterium]|nr:MFS transporter [Dehalococcoidales bacterium]